MIHQNLNKKQQEAVDYFGGPLLIVAGAGSGKTRTLTNRLAQILSSGANPESVIAITFTNKAAEEMRTRISDQQLTTNNLRQMFVADNNVVGRQSSVVSPFIGTFHSLGARILKKEAGLLKRGANFSIFDSEDSLRLIKSIVKNFNFGGEDKKNSNPLFLRKEFSRIKNELKHPNSALQMRPSEYPGNKEEIVKILFDEYEKELRRNNAFDFDDLIEKPVRIFQQYKLVLEKYQNRFQHILVDEFQDTNMAQYAFIKLLAQKHRNLSVVGDDQQCLPPETKITTSKGLKEIKNLTLKDRILAAGGSGEICESKILKIVKNKYKGPLIKITTINNKVIKMTPNHLVFGRLPLLTDIYFVYLMYRKDKGFRIGITKGARINKKNKEMQIGLIVRNNQEKADKIWIIKLCSDRPEAEYYEFYYAFKYGIPTVVFDTNNRSMRLSQNYIDKLYKDIDTKSRAAKLMKEELIYFNYPHWLPQGTIRHSSRRLRVRLALFDDCRKSLIHPWGMSRISVNTKDLRLKKEIEKLGFKTRRGKSADWRLEIASLYYKKLEKIAAKIESINSEIEIVRTACLTKNKRLFFQPAAHIRPRMLIAVNNKNKVVEEVVKKVEIEYYDGFVYDLNIKNVHNYIANNFVVHNSIYGFRGSDFRNFLNFENDWPNAKIVLLEQNYRSSGNIIRASSEMIANNKFQKPKKLWTENNSGELLKIIEHSDETAEAEYVAEQIARLQNLKIEKLSNENNLSIIKSFNYSMCGILYRTNAQSRAIESALIERGINYSVFGGLKFYERKEIKDILAGLRWGFNQNDSVSLERLKKNFLKKPFLALKEKMPEIVLKTKPAELIGHVLEISGYFNYLKKNYLNAEERIENINELIHYAAGFNDLAEFLERVSLFQSGDTLKNKSAIPEAEQVRYGAGSNKQSAVNLMTIHLAKGLEFDRVFIVGCNEGLLPHQMSYRDDSEIEEERRLMYVAMTRAKKELFLSFYNLPSRFLSEIPMEFCEFVGERDLEDEERYITVD